MGRVKYDEFQLAKRYKTAYHTMIILFIVVGINGFVKSSYGAWAEPELESIVLLSIPGLYFAGRSIWQNAYLRINDRPTMILVLSGFAASLGFFSLGTSVFAGDFLLIEDGQLSGQIGLVLMCSLFTMIFTLLVVRRIVDRRAMGE